ncbi:hypothetical protein BJ878DRAFT_431518, partial [Calycina marina]
LRFSSVVPMNERVSVRDVDLPTGGGPDGKSTLFITKNQCITMRKYTMQI